MPNQLANEISPYLLQHADNPVHWYPWGPEALNKAKDEQKPIFLSIGYSACHWCHVMAHESFESEPIAGILNEHFVSIKVDREERPELDQIYMEAVQILTGHGGWPMSVFLTPDLEPFFGGTYWPARARGGMPGFDQVLRAVTDAWNNRRDETVQQARRLTEAIRDSELVSQPGDREQLNRRLFEVAEQFYARLFDAQHGGFGTAPKFPHPMELRVLLRWHRRTKRPRLLNMATTTLDKMAAGGIYDHLGGGFHRYSVDQDWLVPHFEKMLYDNALLAATYVEAWQVTQNGDYARVVREILDYVLRDMTDPLGGFYSTEDADSEGEEGKFYVWTPAEIESVLSSEKAKTFSYVYDVTGAGNFEGHNILHLAKTTAQCAKILGRDPEEFERELAESRAKLLEARAMRVRPGRDDKILVSWNGLMIDAMARAGVALDELRYLQGATAAAQFLVDHLRDDGGGLLHTWRAGQAKGQAYLDDYAALANALVSLYEARFEERWIDEAVRLADNILRRFADPEGTGFFTAPSDSLEPLIARKKDLLDSSVPSGSALAVTALLRLGKLCGRDDYTSAAESTLQASAVLMEKAPLGTGQMLMALDSYLGPTPEIVILGDGVRAASEQLLSDLHHRFLPNKVVAYRDADVTAGGRSDALSSIFAGKELIPPGPTLFVCENFTCTEPVSGKQAATQRVAELAGA